MKKYGKTWAAIDSALSQSQRLQQHEVINRLVNYMRKYPADAELLDWNIAVCAGYEMEDVWSAPLWNGVLDVFHAERQGEGLVKWNKVNKVAGQITKEATNVNG